MRLAFQSVTVVIMLSHSSVAVNRQVEEHRISVFNADNACFRIIPDTTPTQQDQACQLRYPAYNRKHGHESLGEQSHQHGTNDCSVSSLLIHITSHTVVGMSSLIFPEPSFFAASSFIQRIRIHPPLAGQKWHQDAAPAQISRFAISSEFKKNSCEIGSAKPDVEEWFPIDKTEPILYKTFDRIDGTLQMSIEPDSTDELALMELPLLRLLSRFGKCLYPIWHLVEYHGLRMYGHGCIDAHFGKSPPVTS